MDGDKRVHLAGIEQRVQRLDDIEATRKTIDRAAIRRDATGGRAAAPGSRTSRSGAPRRTTREKPIFHELENSVSGAPRFSCTARAVASPWTAPTDPGTLPERRPVVD